MRARQVACGLFVVALGGAPSRAHAGGWTQRAGATYAKVWTRSIVGTLAYGNRGARETIRGLPRYQDHQLNLYVEHGLLDSLTLVARSTPVGVAAMSDDVRGTMGAQGVGLRQALLAGDWPLALEASYAWTPPVGSEVLFEDERRTTRSPTALRTVRTQATFSGHQFGGELQVGHAFAEGRWLSMALGMRWFSHPDVTPALVGLVQLGRQWRPELAYEAHLTLYDPLAASIPVTNPLGAGPALPVPPRRPDAAGPEPFPPSSSVSSVPSDVVMRLGLSIRLGEQEVYQAVEAETAVRRRDDAPVRAGQVPFRLQPADPVGVEPVRRDPVAQTQAHHHPFVPDRRGIERRQLLGRVPLRFDRLQPFFRQAQPALHVLPAAERDPRMRARADADIVVIAPVAQIVTRFLARPGVVADLVGGQAPVFHQRLGLVIEGGGQIFVRHREAAQPVVGMERGAGFDGELIERQMPVGEGERLFELGTPVGQRLLRARIDQVERVARKIAGRGLNRPARLIGAVLAAEKPQHVGAQRLHAERDPVHAGPGEGGELAGLDRGRVGLQRNLQIRAGGPGGARRRDHGTHRVRFHQRRRAAAEKPMLEAFAARVSSERNAPVPDLSR